MGKMRISSWWFYLVFTVIIGIELKYEYPGQLLSLVVRSLQDGCITLVIKLLNFFIAKCFQMRYLSPMLPPPFSGKLMFWIVICRTVFELYY
ncbi:hypothetical protein HanIR_Chr15g0768121 [Helianthus annuus]|nr:hypothetical protein HanIR_Chr15g0768121 [Helianthus annuus]